MCGCGKPRPSNFGLQKKQLQILQKKRAMAIKQIPKKQIQQARRKINQLRNKRKNMKSPFAHRYYLRY